MKKLSIILLFLMFLIGCGQEEQYDEIITQEEAVAAQESPKGGFYATYDDGTIIPNQAAAWVCAFAGFSAMADPQCTPECLNASTPEEAEQYCYE